jgi:serine/threonine protein kinase
LFDCSGSLDKLLFGNDENEKPTISLERKMELIQGIARGVLHLHKHNIIHRDLAARNILLSGSGEPKITVYICLFSTQLNSTQTNKQT